MNRIKETCGSDSSAGEEVEKLRKRKAYSTKWKMEAVKHAKLVSIHSDFKKLKAKSSMWIERLPGIGSRMKILHHRSNVVWNAPFKAKIQELYNNWMLNHADKEWATNGNPPSPSMSNYLFLYLLTLWRRRQRIHCFKERRPVPEGMQFLQDARFSATDDLSATEEIDSDHDKTNGYLIDEDIELQNFFLIAC
uniref:Uncharacterized protein n=1 Tax=Ditylenchus dipsaci TaxID=166011 RepID=A0A915DT07_9BILA